jgi:hypothetical protein
MLQLGQKVLARAESTRDPKRRALGSNRRCFVALAPSPDTPGDQGHNPRNTRQATGRRLNDFIRLGIIRRLSFCPAQFPGNRAVVAPRIILLGSVSASLAELSLIAIAVA